MRHEGERLPESTFRQRAAALSIRAGDGLRPLRPARRPMDGQLVDTDRPQVAILPAGTGPGGSPRSVETGPPIIAALPAIRGLAGPG